MFPNVSETLLHAVFDKSIASEQSAGANNMPETNGDVGEMTE